MTHNFIPINRGSVSLHSIYRKAQTATIILPGLPQPPIIVKSAPMARLHDDWYLLVYPFGVVIWQNVSNMSCKKNGISPLCIAKLLKKLQLSHFYSPNMIFF